MVVVPLEQLLEALLLLGTKLRKLKPMLRKLGRKLLLQLSALTQQKSELLLLPKKVLSVSVERHDLRSVLPSQRVRKNARRFSAHG